MARYKHIDTNPKVLPVDLARQLLPGTFEHALHHLLDGPIDLSSFDARFRNDETGAPAYPPALLLTVVLFAYSQGIVSSRGIEQACREHVTFIALRGDTAPHFTTIAHFVSTVRVDIARVFAAVVAICDAQGLIGREMVAIDGVKRPSNASKRRSGTRADVERQATKLEAVAATMLQRHREADTTPSDPTLAAKGAKRIERLERDAAQMRDGLAANPDDRRGVKSAIRKSNRTDNESAKMATGKGVIQGDTGVAKDCSLRSLLFDSQQICGNVTWTTARGLMMRMRSRGILVAIAALAPVTIGIVRQRGPTLPTIHIGTMDFATGTLSVSAVGSSQAIRGLAPLWNVDGTKLVYLSRTSDSGGGRTTLNVETNVQRCRSESF